jgi:hypothetical protein
LGLQRARRLDPVARGYWFAFDLFFDEDLTFFVTAADNAERAPSVTRMGGDLMLAGVKRTWAR